MTRLTAGTEMVGAGMGRGWVQMRWGRGEVMWGQGGDGEKCSGAG